MAETAQRRLGELDFGPQAAIDYDDVLLDLFDTHLKPGGVFARRQSAVRYFVMGSNEWREAPSWPPPEVQLRRLCLQTRVDNGVLGDCADFDLWVRMLDVYPDGRAINLMSPGADVQRVSYRDGNERQLLRPGEIVAVTIDGLLTANRFDIGHRIRLHISASFAPHLSRNL